MLLWDEEGVEVPKARVDVANNQVSRTLISCNKSCSVLLCSRHLYEALVEEDIPELLPHLVQRM